MRSAIRLLTLAVVPFVAGAALASPATIAEDLRLTRDQAVQVSRPCDRAVEELGKQLDSANQAASRTAADNADRLCEQARGGFATLRPPGSLPPAAQEQLREFGRRMAAGMSGRRKAISSARDFLIKPDKATAELYKKRMIDAQEQIGKGIELLKQIAAEQKVDLSQ